MAKRTLLTEIYSSIPTIPYADGDELLHLESNGYECDNPECICHAEGYAQEAQDTYDENGTHTPDCRCAWCEPADVLK